MMFCPPVKAVLLLLIIGTVSYALANTLHSLHLRELTKTINEMTNARKSTQPVDVSFRSRRIGIKATSPYVAFQKIVLKEY